MKEMLQSILPLFGGYKLLHLYLHNEIKFIKKFMDSSFGWKKYMLFRLNRKKYLKKYMEPSVDWKGCFRYNPYYLRYGFKFPNYESEYYAANTGVRSDLYLPVQLFSLYILPYLNHKAWQPAFANKNMMSRFLDIAEANNHVDVRVPECVAYCDNGRYFLGRETSLRCNLEEAIKAVLASEGDLIIKPAVLSAHGDGVKLLRRADKTENNVRTLFQQYGYNFLIQKKIIQHPELAKLNPTSVNTIRITTYQNFDGQVKILYATQRFGGKDRICDNADPHDDPEASGGFCAIKPDGTYVREVHHIRTIKTNSLPDDIIEKIPYFDKVKETVLFLHSRFPHFALIAWDMSISPDGHPIVVEYNFFPGLATCQLVHGPMFSKEDLDEIMDRVSKGHIKGKSKYVVSFPSKESYWI